MAPAQSKLAASLATGPSTSTKQKRKASSKITNDNSVGADVVKSCDLLVDPRHHMVSLMTHDEVMGTTQ